MFQRIGIDQHTTLARMIKRTRRNALYVIAREKNLTAYIYKHKTEPKVFAVAFEEINSHTLTAISMEAALVLNFVRKNTQVFEIVDGAEILVGDICKRAINPSGE